MELDFNKEKQRVSGMSDAALIAKIRDPRIDATDRMLVESEIARRGVNRRQHKVPPMDAVVPSKKGSRFASNLISLVVIGGIVLSILAGILEDMDIDLIEMLREFFFGAEG